jgi:ABC-2 type transport system ATP-binding protein
MSFIISVDNLRKTYGKTVAVDDISFNVSSGEIFGLLGPNGAGKTTTVECLQALRSPDSGDIRILGLDLRYKAREIRRRIGSQLQESALPDRIKVWEALDLFASVASNALDWHVLLEQWELTGKRNAGFHSLSGGQKQRLFIALALVNNPEIVFLDEMTTGLDPATRRVAWDLIRAIRDRGTTVILVTHFMDEAETLCDRLAIIDRGKVVVSDTPSRLIAAHVKQKKVLFSTDRADLSWLKQVPGVNTVKTDRDSVVVEGSGPLLALVAAALVEHGIIPADLRQEQPSLEDVFLNLTGRSAGE